MVAARRISVDPGVGDPDAPIGSEEWAKHIRLQLESSITHVHEGPDHLGRYLDTIVRHECWKVLTKPDGGYFGSLEEFCVHRRPWGLGMSAVDVAQRVALASTGQAFKALLPPAPSSAGEQALTIEQAKALPVHPAANLLPMLGEADLAKLAADIAEHGLRHSIVLLEGQVLDGRNRLLACERAGVEPRAETLTACPSPTAYVLSANIARRHLDESQRAMVGQAAMVMFEDENRAARAAGLKQNQPANPVPANLPEREKGESREKAAALVGVSPRLIQSARTVSKEAAPELVEAVRAGEVSVSAAAAVAALPAEEQRAHVAAGTVKEAAREVREKKKAKTKAPSAPVAPKAERPEPPDACKHCGGKAFRYSLERDHEGKPLEGWTCKKEGCGRIERPTPKASVSTRKDLDAEYLAALDTLRDARAAMTDAQKIQIIEAAKAIAAGRAA